jgi:fucose permease
MNSAKTNWGNLLPVFLSFVVMGFVDIIGVATGYIKQDFKLSDLIVQFLPMMVLLWYFILSVPAGILQDRYGKRKMLNLGMLVQAAGLGLPFIHYSFGMMFASFILLGIGNTVIQVSANPLLQDVSPAERLPSYLSTSQFIKAIISFLGPIIATFFAVSFGNWRLVFAVYGITSVVAALWLSTTRIKESQPFRKPASFSSCFGLLGDRFISLMALSIFLIVGVEVAVNTNIANVLVASYDITFEKAALGISIFFAGETISRFLGAVILNYMRPRLFLLILALLALAGVAGVFLAPVVIVAFISIFILGLGAGSMFPVIFSIALKTNPDRANEISGLLIMAVSGGAVIPLIMGLFITLFGSLASLSVIAACMLYILWVSWYLRDKTAK